DRGRIPLRGRYQISPGDDDFGTAEALASGPMTPPAPVLERASSPLPVAEPGAGRRQAEGWPRFRRGGRAMAAAATIRREWAPVVFGGSAVFALVTALTSFNAPERVGGAFASVSYATAAITAAVVRRRGPVARRRGLTLAGLISLAGGPAAPLAWVAYTGMAPPEVGVIIRSAGMLVHQGTPYANPAALPPPHRPPAHHPPRRPPLACLRPVPARADRVRRAARAWRRAAHRPADLVRDRVRGRVGGGGPDHARPAPGVVDRAGPGPPGGRAAARGRRGRPAGA